MTYLGLSLGWMLVPLLNTYRLNVGSFPPSNLLRPLIVLVILHLLLYGALRLRFRDDRAGVLLSCFWVCFFLGGPLESFRGGVPVSAFWILWIIMGVAGVFLALTWRRSPVPSGWRTFVWVGAFLGTVQVILLVPTLFRTSGVAPGREAGGAAEVEPPPQGGLPNIFYIVLDGYGRQDVLKQLYDFDNEPFLRRLEEKGFCVLRKATSNYANTLPSLSSSLNMDYIQNFHLPLRNVGDAIILKGILTRNRVRKRLMRFGYRFTAIETGYELTDLRDAERYVMAASRLNEFEMGLAQMTPFSRLPGFARLSQWETHRRRVRGIFHALEELAADPGPQFVFAHVVCPHPPFVFDAAGNFPGPTPGDFMASGDFLVGVGGLSEAEHHFRYRAQVEYLNRLIEESLARMVTPGMPPALIILQGDHGPDSETHFRRPDLTNRFERFNILFAIRTPPGLDLRFPQDLMPVNLFRSILSQEFGEDLDPLPERHFLSSCETPFDFFSCPPETLRLSEGTGKISGIEDGLIRDGNVSGERLGRKKGLWDTANARDNPRRL